MSVYEKLDGAVGAVAKEFESKEWRASSVLDELAQKLRLIGMRASEADEIRGYVLILNGVDASNRVANWPQHIFEPESLKIEMQILGVEEVAQTAIINHEIGAEVAAQPAGFPEPEAEEAEEVDHEHD